MTIARVYTAVADRQPFFSVSPSRSIYLSISVCPPDFRRSKPPANRRTSGISTSSVQPDCGVYV